jgi:F-type H+-transporting ATPase subunit a
MSETQTITPDQYIHHHLSYWTVGQGFWSLNVDTLLFSVGLGSILLLVMYLTARRATVGVPGRWQSFVEYIVVWINGNVKQIFHYENPLIAPLAITLFVWIWVMNFMDIVPVDLLPRFGQFLGMNVFGATDPEQVYLKVVPTNDMNMTFGLSLGVFVLTLYYSFTKKGLVGYGKEFIGHPFEAKHPVAKVVLILPNILMNVVETISKPLSLSLRLFGNLFAGEILFILIAMLPWWGTPFTLLWMLFHLLIITIQAFVFMMLTVVYLGMAHTVHDSHAH